MSAEMILTSLVFNLLVLQASLVIRSLGIRGFDYLWARKQGKNTNNKKKPMPLHFQVLISHEHIPL